MRKTRTQLNDLGSQIIGAAIEAHRELGPGLLESVYEYCLLDELKKLGLTAERQVSLPIVYKGNKLDKTYYVDILVENEIVIELKCVDILHTIHEVQVVT